MGPQALVGGTPKAGGRARLGRTRGVSKEGHRAGMLGQASEEPPVSHDQLAHYRILRPLGSGGMGEVYLAEDLRLQRKVALKVLRADHAEGDAGRKRFLREAQAVAQLDHPNVCTVYEVGESDRGAYIAMQYIEGENLHDLMLAQRLELGPILDLGIQVVDALAEAHAQGIIHRDIKPQNILITPKGQAKVLDFGLAKRLELTRGDETGTILTNPGMVLGTVPYMSPEQVKGEELDGRSDLFSLGAVLFELATGKRPFEARSGAELMALILTHDPFDVADPALPLNAELRRILQRALAKEPAARYPTAREMREDLQRLRTLVTGGALGLGDDATTINRPRPAGLPSVGLQARTRRRRGLALALGGAVALGLAVGAYVWMKPSGIDSIAVLPIANESGDPGMDYVSDGLTENLIAQLSGLPHLKVIARSSVLRFKAQAPDPAKLGMELGVKAILVGRMRTENGQLKLSLEMADTRNQRRLWGVQLLRPANDLLNLQESLAEQVAANLGRTQPDDRKAVADTRIRTTNSQAYDLYLKGRFYADRWLPSEVEKALAYFDQALALDPSFVLPHIGKANAYWGLSSSFRPGGEMMPKVKQEAEAAIKLDPNHAEALALRGMALISHDRDVEAANRDFRKALAFAPSSPVVLQTFAFALMTQGKAQESVKLLKQAIAVDPLSPLPWTFLGITQQTAGNFKAAQEAGQRVVSLEPDFYFGHLILGTTALHQGRRQEALKELDLAAASGSNYALAFKGKALGLSGRTEEARAVLAFLQSPKARENGYVSPLHLALVHLGLGQRKEALALVDQAIDLHEEEAIGLPYMLHWKELREEPGFQAILAKLRNH